MEYVYADLIRNGYKTLEQVPEKLRGKVNDILLEYEGKED